MSVFLVLTQAYRSLQKTHRGLRQENCHIRLNNNIFDPAILNFQIGQRITSNTNKSL